MAICHLLLVLAFALPSFPAAAPKDPIGVVTQANDAYLSDDSVSTGTTVYDGDHLSTEVDGVVRVRSGSAMLYLTGLSSATLHGALDPAKGAQAELETGTLVFSTAQAAALVVCALDASIRAASDIPTVGQITVAGPKKLYISARRGTLIFSYRDEVEEISEGQSYRVVLDPPDDPAAKPDGDNTSPKPTRRRRGFLFFLIGLAIAPVIYHFAESTESPYSP